jgi:hypothetical protein
MKPRNTLEATRAYGQMRKAFFVDWLEAHLKQRSGDEERELCHAKEVFEETILNRLRARVGEEALQTRIVGTDDFSNRIGTVCISLQDGSCLIAINTRFQFDAEHLAHALIEEMVHVQQTLEGVDFSEQRQTYAYVDRPYEREAKQIATAILGYDASEHVPLMKRPEPQQGLLDK